MRVVVYLTLALVACGGSGADVDAGAGDDAGVSDGEADSAREDATRTYFIRGSVSGLLGAGLTLQLNGAEELAIDADGPFAFLTPLHDGDTFEITVSTQPASPKQSCTISNGGTGTIVSADVEIISVTCVTNRYAVGGTVSGLEGTGLVLQNNEGDDLAVTMNGGFTFATALEDQSPYDVTVITDPTGPNQRCTVNRGTGTLAGNDITDVSVICSTDTHSVSGTATGVTSDVILTNNGGDPITVSTDGAFAFPLPVADGAMFEVAVLDTTGQYCVVEGGQGTIRGADVTDVLLSCGPVPATVEALYPTRGLNWNDYVLHDGVDRLHASGASCDSGRSRIFRYDECIHGGEMRMVEVLGKSSCEGLTLTESLDLFDWVCDDSTDPVRMISTGLRDGRGLRDLLDFGAAAWRPNSVTVRDDGVEHFTTPAEAWWANPVVVDNDGGPLDQAGTIYIVTSPALTTGTGGYVVGADRIGMVTEPGIVIHGPGIGANSTVVETLAGMNDYLWMEVDVDGSADEEGIRVGGSWHSVLQHTTERGAMASFFSTGVVLSLFASRVRDLTVRGTETSGLLVYGSHTDFTRIRSENHAAAGMLLAGRSHRFDDLSAENCGATGISVGGEDPILSHLSAHSNRGVGIRVSTTAGSLIGLTSSNNTSHGIMIEGAEDCVFAQVTSVSNGGDGVHIENTPSQLLKHLTAVGNGQTGVFIQLDSPGTSLLGLAIANNGIHGLETIADETTVHGIATVDNAQAGIRILSNNNRFTGSFAVGNNGSFDCYVSNGATAPGLDDDADPSDMGNDAAHDGICVEEGTSDFGTARVVASLGPSFVGRTYDDAVNTSDTGAGVPFPAMPGAFDWSAFEHPFRAWGPDAAYGAASQDPWTVGNGAIWDWSPPSGDTVLLGTFLPADSTELFSHMRSTSTTMFLANAIEILDDGVGDDDGLCRSGEECLHTPNLGAYQGHGNLVHLADIPTAGTFTNIVLRGYDTNGR